MSLIALKGNILDMSGFSDLGVRLPVSGDSSEFASYEAPKLIFYNAKWSSCPGSLT